MKIVFPEGNNELIIEATNRAEQEGLCEPVLLDGTPEALTHSMQMVANGQADAVIAGIDYTSRDVILGARDFIGMRPDIKTFSGIFVLEFPDGRVYVVGDCATCKHPTAEQLTDIIMSTVDSARKILPDAPSVAILSFSTKGSGGHDDTIDTARTAIEVVKKLDPTVIIDGEMQLDAAVNPRVGDKKAPGSPIAGKANVLIAPDLNSGNILYKAMQQFGGAMAYGPILQGFNRPVSDLSRGSTVDDIYGVIKTIRLL